MAVYRIREDSLYLYEILFYGSSRLGVIKENKLLKVKTAQNNIGVMSLPIPVNIAQSKNKTKPNVYTMGKKHYETTDRPGNVRVTYTDKKSWNNGKFSLNVSSSQDYYPFGSVMEGRVYSFAAYRFGFNGKENDNEVIGMGRWQDYGARMYRPDLARFFSPDPLIVKEQKFPWYSPYQFAGNKPIFALDLDGKEEYVIIRWYDSNNLYVGSTIFRIENANDRLQPTGTLIVNKSSKYQENFNKNIESNFKNFLFLLNAKGIPIGLKGGKILISSPNEIERKYIALIKDFSKGKKSLLSKIFFNENLSC